MTFQINPRFFRILPVVVFAVWGSFAQASVIFNFDTDNVGTTTTFTDTAGGFSATFSSPDDPGEFVIMPTYGLFDTLTGNVLGDPAYADVPNAPLSITLSAPATALSLAFVTDDYSTPSPFVLDAYNGSTLVGTATSTGIYPSGYYFPEGEISFTGATFTSVVLSTTAPDFAIDNVLVAPATAAPEPASSALLLLGLLGMAPTAVAGVRRRILSRISKQ
jgi:hypothetical protein